MEWESDMHDLFSVIMFQATMSKRKKENEEEEVEVEEEEAGRRGSQSPETGRGEGKRESRGRTGNIGGRKSSMVKGGVLQHCMTENHRHICNCVSQGIQLNKLLIKKLKYIK